MSEFIEVMDALMILDKALDENDLSVYIKTIIVNYGFFELPLYVSFDKGEQITLANDIQKKLYRDFMLDNIRNKTKLGGLNVVNEGLMPAIVGRIFRVGSYYWKVDDFYKNPIFTELKAIPNKDKVVYCSIKLDNEEIQEIADKELKAKLEQVEANLKQAYARIAELESEQGINHTENPLFVLGAIMQTIKQISKTNYTQTSHYQFIIDNYEGTGLSPSNFEKTVSYAKNFFLQKVNKKSK